MANRRTRSLVPGLYLTTLVAGACATAGACVTSGTVPAVGVDAAFSDDSAAGDGGYSLANCPNGGLLAASCATCIETSCASAIGAVDNACASELACACPLGVDALACAPTAACTSAVSAAAAQCSSCKSACGLGGEGGLDAALDSTPGLDAGPDATLEGGSDASIDAPGSTDAADAADATPLADAACPTDDAGVEETNCAGTCTDLTTDPLHCGSCAHACSVTAPSTVACNTGRCLITLATPALNSGDFVDQISISGGNAYFATSSNNTTAQIQVVPIGGGAATTLVTGTGDAISGLAAGSGAVYWSSHYFSQILALPLDGGTTVTLASGQSCEAYPTTWNCTQSVALAGSSLYYTASGPYTETSPAIPGVVQTVQTNGSGGRVLATDATNGGNIGRTVATSTGVFWMNAESKTAEEVPLDGGTVSTLVSGIAVADIAADQYNLYFVDGTNVYAAPLDGGTVTTLATGQQAARVASDSTSVYWANTNFSAAYLGAVVKAPIGGGAPTTLVSGLQKLWALAADGTNVYVSGYSTQAVLQQLPAQ